MTNKDMEVAVADSVDLTAEQRKIKRSPRGAGTRTLLDYKLGWSRTILRKIGAIQKVAAATWEITNGGREMTKADIDNSAQMDERGVDGP